MEKLPLELILYQYSIFPESKTSPSNPRNHRHCLLSTMEEDRGPILTINVLIFGIITLCFVAFRISFRLYTRKTSASDWFLAVALASLTLPPSSHGEDMEGLVASGVGLMLF